MGGIAQFGLSQLSPDQQAALQQQLAPAQTSAQPQPATTGYNSDISSAGAQPINSPVAPGSTGDLESRAQQLGQTLQQQQQAPQQQQPQQQGFSQNNPYAAIAQDYMQRAQAAAPKPVTGPPVKQFLQHFFSGMGSSMQLAAGITPPDIRAQQLQQHAMTMMQAANQWEETQGMQRYRNALTSKMEQDAAFEAQMQPMRLTQEQQTIQQQNAAFQQSQQTVHPAMSAEDLKSLGVPDDLAKQYQGKPLTSADFGALKDLSAAGATKIFDYGRSGQGTGKGQWLVDKNYTPIKQLSPISESGSARELQREQFAQQNAQMKGASTVVVAWDPNEASPDGSKGRNVVMTQGAAQQRGLFNYKADPSTINSTIGGFNDVQNKMNMLADVVNNPQQMGQVQAGIAADLIKGANKGVTVGISGLTVDMSNPNSQVYASQLAQANQATRNFVAASIAAHEAITQLPRLQTFGKSNRMTQQQMEAAQNMLPAAGDDPRMAAQKMDSVQTTIDPLRKQLPKMPGADLLPTWKEKQTSVFPSVGTQQGPTQPVTGGAGFNWNNYPVASAPR